MGEDRISDSDPFDLESLRLSDSLLEYSAPRGRLPRHRRGDPFLKGPIAYAWVASACRLPGAGLAVAMSCRFQAKRFGHSRGRHWGIGDIAEGLQISGDSVRRGLDAAERARLVSVSREPGCKSTITILEFVGPDAGAGHRPLYGPIPWSWWAPASRLPGRSLQVATVCWLLAGWGRTAEFELVWDDWAEVGLSRSSASRGLDSLERAGLVGVVRRSGHSPIVTILDQTMAPERNGTPAEAAHLL
jgi:DNA-binding MarR family transcriptional regulator